ncbi:MAG: HEAT repeat domain-containing protein [Okeania sp. SIO2G4]|uniref:HEAT repeat domain-containing protein n=1 Tax=unclassified Okeania TaxID=2634635 RepID=UPI0013B5EFFC|nr:MULTISPECIES: HEAT repeat domain-containing protein [unclassified Okeania]NEP07726.1 HEAT repeat domain-containing protein [Okeania sp. SIO4D6]NEP76090.1 HEAT repeat domain-containing protein [Okeania sp. SIO2G5]NEP97269.1 HEAT repeat domain-containing protein [Okeania sp. SIO2F5]NEQ94991.1 HEAT repeat domain-containing protein [Okeania sp. SIO2G4]
MSPEETDAFLASARKEVVQQTFDSNDSKRLKLMVESLGDSRGMVRLGFAETLGQIGKPATPFLIEALGNHPDPVVRRASAKTLTLIADPEAVSPLVHALLNDEDTVVKGSSVGALARIGKAAVPPLLDILGSTEYPESTKGHAAWALAFIGPEAKEYLYREIHSEKVAVRAAVVGAIAKIAQDSGEEEALNILLTALGDSSEIVRTEAAAVLGNLAYKPAVPRLVELLNNPTSGETRKAAALSLMKIRSHSALVPLQAAWERESEADIKQIIKLAITQLERQSSENDWE